MRVAMIGTGYVGLVSGACFSDFGHEVICVDKDVSKIDRLKKGEIPIFEPGLDTLVANNVRDGRLSFTTDLKTAVPQADAVFIAVGTPSRRGDGFADLSYVFAASEEIADAIDGYTVVVNKSTVPVGTGGQVEDIIRKRRPDAEFDVVSNPEFLREGNAIDDFMHPDRVVVGTESDKARRVMAELYRPLSMREKPVLFTSRQSSELIKYAANAFLATKISFINEIADLCEKVDADIRDVSLGIGMDDRIGKRFLQAGPGFGGSCFPKDTLALVKTARDAHAPIRIVESVVEVNKDRKRAMADKIVRAAGGSVKGKTIGVLGLTFKPNTDDMRDSPSLDIIPILQEQGATIRAYDPEGMEEAKKHFKDVTYCKDAYDTLRESDLATILTEWNEFRALDLERVKQLIRTKVLVDLRNIYSIQDMHNLGFDYHCVGRPYRAPRKS